MSHLRLRPGVRSSPGLHVDTPQHQRGFCKSTHGSHSPIRSRGQLTVGLGSSDKNPVPHRSFVKSGLRDVSSGLGHSEENKHTFDMDTYFRAFDSKNRKTADIRSKRVAFGFFEKHIRARGQNILLFWICQSEHSAFSVAWALSPGHDAPTIAFRKENGFQRLW